MRTSSIHLANASNTLKKAKKKASPVVDLYSRYKGAFNYLSGSLNPLLYLGLRFDDYSEY
jgi:hypothetical protein